MVDKKSEYSHTNLINELRITLKDFITYLITYLHLNNDNIIIYIII